MTPTLRARAIRVALLATAVTITLTACSGHRGPAVAAHSPQTSTSISLSAPGSTAHSTASSALSSTAPPGSTPPVHKVAAAPGETALPSGSTGRAGDIPWTLVGPGWRLVQPGSYQFPTSTLYLYDPAGGRYLITDQLPANGMLTAWSPDGRRVLLESTDNVQQVDLATGQLISGFARGNRQFVSYTKPNGLALMLYDFDQRQLVRVDADGRVEHQYPQTIAGVGFVGSSVTYTADGSAFLAGTSGPVLLMGNGGSPIRAFAMPAGFAGGWGCNPGRWWTSTSFTEDCETRQGYTTTFVQPLDGGQPSKLITAQSPTGLGYDVRQRLSNGDTLLTIIPGCGSSAGYAIRNVDGSVHPLRLPAGVPAPGTIVAVSGDVATFKVSTHLGCVGPQSKPTVRMIDYNLVTGATSTFLTEDALIQAYPR